MLTRFKNLLKDLWDPNWRMRELHLRRFEEIFKKGDEEIRKRDEARDELMRRRGK